MNFNMLDFIEDKKLAKEHDAEAVNQFISLLVQDKIPDYQVSAWLMAVRLNGMTDREMSSLTLAMAESGDMVDLSDFPSAVDKHSTGGVGDKTSLVIAPLVASAGVPVIKFSGRALDFTGGTIDKLESIPGFNTQLEPNNVLAQAEKTAIVLAGTSGNLAPADKILYAMRDVTSTVDSIPLIAASIMSKKIASGARSIVLDVKYGDGAFMVDCNDSIELAEKMLSIGRILDRNMGAVISSMENPLGRTVGNALEVIEAIDTLKGNGTEDLVELCLTLGAKMISLSRDDPDMEGIKSELSENIRNGKALDKFEELIKAQNGNYRVIDDYGLFSTAQFRFTYNASQDGYISTIKTREIGNLVRSIGGGRYKKSDEIDPSVGIRFFKKPPDAVSENDRIADIYYNNEQHLELIQNGIADLIQISKDKPEKHELIKKII